MEIKATMIIFNSTPENYETEMNQKNCTVRRLSNDDLALLKKSRIKWIGIRNEETKEMIVRPIANITYWDERYIFTWVPFEKPQPVEYKGLEVMHNG